MSVLDEAHHVVYGDREKTYGRPSKNLIAIATMWEGYLFSRGLLTDEADGIMIHLSMYAAMPRL